MRSKNRSEAARSGGTKFIRKAGCVLQRYEAVWVILLILLGTALRVLYLGIYPVGLNQDEASAGYEAWSLLHYGVDRNGVSWPVLFISWGSGQNVLYSYLSIPFIALLGLNEFSVRLVAAIAGCLSLPMMWHMTRRMKGVYAGLIALLVLSLCPWHIMISRWALESNLLPFFLLLGMYFLTLAVQEDCQGNGVCGSPRHWFLVPAGAAFGLSLYAYGTAFVFLAFFLVMAVIWLIRRRLLFPMWKEFLTALAVFIVLALPITLCNLINVLGMEEISLFGLTLPILTQTRQATTMSFSVSHFADFLRLLWKQSDSLAYNAVDGFMFFPGYLFFAAAGAAAVIHDTWKNRAGGEVFWLMALIASLLSSFFIEININRMNMAFLPIAWLTAYGIYRIVAWAAGRNLVAGRLCGAGAAVLLAASTAFAGTVYLTSTMEKLSVQLFEGLGDALQYAAEQEGTAIYVTDSVKQPYIFVLFYNQISPEEFGDTVVYEDEGAAFRRVLSFSGYEFGSFEEMQPEDGVIYVLDAGEYEGLEILAEFGNYIVGICE